MTDTSLQTFIDRTRAAWGPLSSALAADCLRHMTALAQAPETEPWLAALHTTQPASRELYRDPAHGFVLLAHAEPAGLYRPLHDHGRGWVIYAVQSGIVEMGTYARVTGDDGRVTLVKRDTTPVRAGQAKLFLPGDIHDTQCLSESGQSGSGQSGPALLLRFTERDLKQEARYITRYADRDGDWTTEPA